MTKNIKKNPDEIPLYWWFQGFTHQSTSFFRGFLALHLPLSPFETLTEAEPIQPWARTCPGIPDCDVFFVRFFFGAKKTR